MDRDFDDEKFKIDPIQKDKGEHEPFSEPPDASEQRFFLSLLVYVKKFLSSLPIAPGTSYQFSKEGEFLDHIIEFRRLLALLMRKDLSRDLNFIEELSKAWLKLVGDSKTLKITQQGDPIPVMKLNFFLNTLSHYPPGEEHSLGFYLSAYAGKDWIPFPFLNILQKVHEDHLAKLETSILTGWISLLGNILPENLDP